jgi:hypothetical protein
MGVTPLVDLMWDRVLLGQIIAMDETPVRELGGRGKTLTGYLWTGVGDAEHPYDCFFYTSDRRTIRPREFLSRYHGYLPTDAYIAYERLGDLGSDILNASCWIMVGAGSKSAIIWALLRRHIRHWPSCVSSLISKMCSDL